MKKFSFHFSIEAFALKLSDDRSLTTTQLVLGWLCNIWTSFYHNNHVFFYPMNKKIIKSDVEIGDMKRRHFGFLKVSLWRGRRRW